MSEKTTLCVQCRATFTDDEIAGASACPSCGNRGLPADLNQKSAITLTRSEWRILFIWADNWAGKIEDREGYDSLGTIASIRREAQRQAPELSGCLSIFEDVQAAVNILGTKAELVRDGVPTAIEPEKKH